MSKQVIRSESHHALNVVWPMKVGKMETRYVDKGGYQVIYISSQTGCNHGCRFCHLTTSGQTDHMNIDRAMFLYQVREGLKHCRPGQHLNFDFMARGEPLANPNLDSDTLLAMTAVAQEAGFKHVRHLISTILPRKFVESHELIDRFPTLKPDIYYSLYTLEETRRKHWMPNAVAGVRGLVFLKQWQRDSLKVPKIHFAIIPGLSDNPRMIRAICAYIRDIKLAVNFNLIEYNPSEPTEEKPEIDAVVAKYIIQEELPLSEVTLIPRIAPDAYVSCGMFAS